jgi:hypothetical protein
MRIIAKKNYAKIALVFQTRCAFKGGKTYDTV